MGTILGVLMVAPETSIENEQAANTRDQNPNDIRNSIWYRLFGPSLPPVY